MDTSRMLDRQCPICLDSSKIRSLSTGWTCDNCYHAWRPKPWKDADATIYFDNAPYTKEESPSVYHIHVGLSEAFERLASAVIKGPKKLMLDFGCAYGICMEVFKKRGWDVFGIEIATNSQKILTEKNLRWAPTIEESGLKDGSVDVIVMSDSIYYLPDPVKTLSQLRNYLAPNGILLLRQPTRAGLVRFINILPGTSKIMQALWCDHIHLFSRRSTVSALARSGFLRIDVLKERNFQRKLLNQAAHQLLHCLDLITFRVFDLTFSWTVCAKLYPPLNRMRFALQGERINLRRIRFSDIGDIFNALRDEDVAKWAAPLDMPASKYRILILARRLVRYFFKTIRYLWWKLFPPKERRIYRFGISLKQTDKIIGMILLTRKGAQYEYGEVGFWIIKEHWGKGLTTEALKMVINFGFKYLELGKIEGWTVEQNIGSQRVMKKCGLNLCPSNYKNDGKYKKQKVGLWFSLLKSEYHGEHVPLVMEKVYAD